MAAKSLLDQIDKLDAELAALQPAVTEALDAEQKKLDDAVDAVRTQNPDLVRAEVNRSDEVRLDAARQHLATVRMHVAELTSTN